MTGSSHSPDRASHGMAPSGGSAEDVSGPGAVLTRHLVISGRVQGVFYRESMRLEAERLGVTGWVRNRRDGAVEAMVQGTASTVAALIAWSWEGPPAARVEAIQEHPAVYQPFTGFQRLPTSP